MGSFVSVPDCQTYYGITVNCSISGGINTTTIKGEAEIMPPYEALGGYQPGEFRADPDIAGIGILGISLSVTSFAILASVTDVFWQISKTWIGKKTYSELEKAKRQAQGRYSLSDVLETLVLSCSDQQVFTGAAYAIVLRYWRGCTISAYHYNIVANMLLLTCATHLLSVTVVRNYWVYPGLAILRIVCITGVFIVTGLVMTNQNAAKDLRFPTGIPRADVSDSPIFLPAACFQGSQSNAASTFVESTKNAKAFFIDTIILSAPDNMIQGWKWYVVTLLFYGVAVLAEVIKFVRRGRSRPGWRGNVAKRFGRHCRLGTAQRKFAQSVYHGYLLVGVTLCCIVTVNAAQYILDLRRWVDHSKWIEKPNSENDSTSFGQLVPIFSSALILFSFAQILSEKATRYNDRKHVGEEGSPPAGTIQYLDPSHYDSPVPTGPYKTNIAYSNLAEPHRGSRPGLGSEHQASWCSISSTSNPNTTACPPPMPDGESRGSRRKLLSN